jgi:hypothetical protein
MFLLRRDEYDEPLSLVEGCSGSFTRVPLANRALATYHLEKSGDPGCAVEASMAMMFLCKPLFGLVLSCYGYAAMLAVRVMCFSLE